MRRRVLGCAVFLAVLLVVAPLTLGIFVVQPIGSVPEGTTILYWRAGLDLPFVVSPDGFSYEATGSVSLLSRGIVMARLVDLLDGRKIVALPYSHSLYLISTDGMEFDR